MHLHRSLSLATLLLAAAMSAAPGCGDDDASASSGSPGPSSSDFFDRYAKAVCGRTFACCDASVRAAHDLNVSTADECASQLAAILESLSGGSMPRATLVPEKGEACLAEVDAAPCAEISIVGVLVGVDEDFTPSCNEAWVGSMAEGESCGTNWDCAKDHCVYNADIEGGGQPMSACKALSAVGEPCESPFDCEDALRCEKPSPSGAGACAPRVVLGGSCEGNSDCEEELHCAQAGTCQPREQAGGPCASDGDCAAGMACEGSLCEPLGAAGAPCDADSDCASFACVKPAGTCADVCHEA